MHWECEARPVCPWSPRFLKQSRPRAPSSLEQPAIGWRRIPIMFTAGMAVTQHPWIGIFPQETNACLPASSQSAFQMCGCSGHGGGRERGSRRWLWYGPVICRGASGVGTGAAASRPPWPGVSGAVIVCSEVAVPQAGFPVQLWEAGASHQRHNFLMKRLAWTSATPEQEVLTAQKGHLSRLLRGAHMGRVTQE